MLESDGYVRMQSYVTLLSKAEIALQDVRNRERLRPPTFNIFSALGHAYREVSTHSAMLAYLLDPFAGHAQGMLFLHRFLDIVRRAAERQGRDVLIPAPGDGHRWQCRSEVFLPPNFGKADILLRGPEFIMILENKVYAGDQHEQLQRYWAFLQDTAQKCRCSVITYLTPDGRFPTAQSVGGNEGLMRSVIRLSYHEDIYELVSSAAESIEAISVAEVLRQYADLSWSL